METMTDRITRARKEWCETPRYPDTRMANICPPAVVSALLDMLSFASMQTRCYVCGGGITKKHRECCFVSIAEAAIDRALEQKP